MKRYGFFNQYRIWGGGEKWHYTAALYLASHGKNVVVFTPKNGELYRKLGDHPQIKRVHITVNKYSYFNPISILKYILKFKSNRVCSIVFNSPTDVRAASFAAKVAGVAKRIYRIGNPSSCSIPAKRSYVIAFNSLTDIVPISNEIRRKLFAESSYLLTKHKIETVIYNAVDFNEYDSKEYHQLYQAQEGEIVLGCLARFSAEKALHYLVDVANDLKKQDVSFKLLLGGCGELEEEIKQMTVDYGLEEEIIFVGFVEKIKDFLKSIDICVFSSQFEGTANSLVEAMAFEKPVVCFDVSSMPEVVTNNETGFTVPLGDTKAFGARVKELIDDKEMRQRFGKEGRIQAQEKFDFNINYGRWLNLLEN